MHGFRHNHCYTSPIYREKTAIINGKLAERYANNDAVIMWHISNEFGGDCHCDLCQADFRLWLKDKYKTLDDLIKAIDDYIYYYNYDRIKTKLKGLSPVNYRLQSLIN